METIDTCPLCGCEKKTHWCRQGVFEVWICRNCNLGYLSPRLKEDAILERYRRPDYYQRPHDQDVGYTDYASQETALSWTFHKLLQKLAPLGVLRESLLEIGCGPGLFLKEAKRYFHSTTGVDFCPEAAQHASCYADRVVTGGIHDLREADFQVIAALNVIEHVYYPIDFVHAAAALLAPGGHMVLVTPDFGGFWRKLSGKFWPSFKIPEHVTFYSRISLKRLSELCNLNWVTSFPVTQTAPLPLILEKFYLPRCPESFRGILAPVPGALVCAVFQK